MRFFGGSLLGGVIYDVVSSQVRVNGVGSHNAHLNCRGQSKNSPNFLL